MSDDSPFDDFSSADANAISDIPIALPPPDESAASSSSVDDEFGDAPADSSEGLNSGAPLEEDPFASVDSTQNKFDSFSQQEQKQDEETPLSIWEKQRKEELSRRAAQAATSKSQLEQTAKAELDKFYADRNASLQKTQKTNRADEKNYKTDMAATMANGTRWEKVTKLVTLQPKSNDKSGSQGGRTDRMRKILIQLKTAKE